VIAVIEFGFFVRVFLIPIIALVTPFVMILWRVYKNGLEIALTRRVILRFVFALTTLTFLIFVLLLYLTNGILTAFRLDEGFFVTDRDITWNATEHLRIIFVYDPGISLLVISFLSGLLYAAVLTLPKICTVVDQKLAEDNINLGSGASTGMSSISATASAFASSAVCCSTSVLAVIAPSLTVFLGPFVPGLLIASFVLLIYSFRSIVLPRFMIPSLESDPGFIAV
jgi:hypothetical protein